VGQTFRGAKNTPALIAALKANPNALQVAKKVRRKFDTVWKIAQEEGIELSQGRAAYEKRCAKITEALKSNPNAPQVARELDVDYYAVYRAARRAHIKLSRQRPERRRRSA